MALDSEMQADLNITITGRLDTASVSQLMLWQNAGTFYTQTSMIRHKASHLMQDTLKSHKTERRKKESSNKRADKKMGEKSRMSKLE